MTERNIRPLIHQDRKPMKIGWRTKEEAHLYRGYVETIAYSRLILQGFNGDVQNPLWQKTVQQVQETIIEAKSMGFNTSILLMIADKRFKQLEEEEKEGELYERTRTIIDEE